MIIIIIKILIILLLIDLFGFLIKSISLENIINTSTADKIIFKPG